MLSFSSSLTNSYQNLPLANNSPARTELPQTQSPSCGVKPVLFAAATHGAKDFVGQLFGRTAGLALLSGLTTITSAEIPYKIVAGGIGAIAAGTQACLIGSHLIGFKTKAQKVALTVCTLSIAAAGASIAAYGSLQPVVVLASCSAAVAAASLIKLCSNKTYCNENMTEGCKALAFTAAVATSVSCAGFLISEWNTQESHIAARSIALLIESSVIELCKSSLDQLGPSVDKNSLSFKGNAAALLMGLPFYTAATIAFNGVVSGSLQPPTDSTKFLELWLPLIVGGLANAVRGTVNASTASYLAAHNIGVSQSENTLLRSHSGILKPDCHKVFQKTAVRVFLSSCRNALYFYLRDKGMAIMPAACLAQGTYSIFAQQRDLIYELMQGKGWSEPILKQRAPALPLHQVIVNIDQPQSIREASESNDSSSSIISGETESLVMHLDEVRNLSESSEVSEVSTSSAEVSAIEEGAESQSSIVSEEITSVEVSAETEERD